MADNLILKTSKPIGVAIFLIFGALGFGAVSIYLISDSLSQEYIQMIQLGFSLFFGIFAVLAMVSLFWLHYYIVYLDYFLIINIFGRVKRKVYHTDIISWQEKIRGEKKNQSKTLILQLPYDKVKIDSLYCPYYKSLKTLLTAGKPHNQQAELKSISKINRNVSIISFAIALLCFYGSFHIYDTKNEVVSQDEIRIVKGTLNNQPEIYDSESIEILLNEYPEFKFKIDGLTYGAGFPEIFVDSVGLNDTIFLLISKKDYLKKIKKTEELGFWDKENYNSIFVYGCFDDEYEFFSLEGYNKEMIADNKIGVIILAVLGVFFLVLSFIAFYNYILKLP